MTLMCFECMRICYVCMYVCMFMLIIDLSRINLSHLDKFTLVWHARMNLYAHTTHNNNNNNNNNF